MCLALTTWLPRSHATWINRHQSAARRCASRRASQRTHPAHEASGLRGSRACPPHPISPSLPQPGSIPAKALALRALLRIQTHSKSSLRLNSCCVVHRRSAGRQPRHTSAQVDGHAPSRRTTASKSHRTGSIASLGCLPSAAQASISNAMQARKNFRPSRPVVTRSPFRISCR